MSRAIKRFSFKAQDGKNKVAPIEFEFWGDILTARPKIQGAVILDFIGASSDAEEDSSALTRRILPFFKSALTEESWETFNKTIRSPDKIVEVDELMDVLSWLISEYTNRPTNGSAESESQS